MTRNTKIILAVIAIAIAAYFGWRWYQNRQNEEDEAVGSNLSSTAPELIGGSSGPSLGPAVSLPVNIVMTESAPASPEREMPEMEEGARMPLPVTRQRMAAGVTQGAGTGNEFMPEDTGDMGEGEENGP